MENLKLQEGQEVTINIPFTYTIGETGYHSGRDLNTIEDCKNEVQAEIDNDVIKENEILMLVDDSNERVLNIYTERLNDIEEYLDSLGMIWKPEFFNFKSYTPIFDDPDDETIFFIKLGELLILQEILRI